MRFAEFQLGQVIHAGPYEVSEEEIVRFATAYDPQWFHTDAQRILRLARPHLCEVAASGAPR